jgi:hypothetical protein
MGSTRTYDAVRKRSRIRWLTSTLNPGFAPAIRQVVETRMTLDYCFLAWRPSPLDQAD